MDKIGDFITRIRNAGMAGRSTTVVENTRFIFSIAQLLKKEGYVGEITEKEIKGRPSLVVEILYTEDGKPVVQGSKRVSKLSGRVYKGSTELRSVRQGLGRAIVSTPQGVMTSEEAKSVNVGGEVLFEIW